MKISFLLYAHWQKQNFKSRSEMNMYYPTITQDFTVPLYINNCKLWKAWCKYTDDFISLREGYFNNPNKYMKHLGKENLLSHTSKENKTPCINTKGGQII